MLYLLDANVLITADRDYYPMDRIPQFWEWVLEHAEAGNIKIPYEIYDEVIDGKDDTLVKWFKKNKKILRLDEEVDVNLLQDVMDNGYGENLNEVDTRKIGKDGFLIAYARMLSPCSVVTLEISSPGKKGSNRKVPDVCNDFKVPWLNTFGLIKTLDFRIK